MKGATAQPSTPVAAALDDLAAGLVGTSWDIPLAGELVRGEPQVGGADFLHRAAAVGGKEPQFLRMSWI